MLSFDAEVLSALFAEINQSLWPWQIACVAAALAALWLAVLRHRWAGRGIGAILAGAWLVCGLVFHLTYFADIGFTAPAYGALFLAQAALLAWSLGVRGRTAFAFRPGVAAWAGGLAITYALVAMPLIAILGGDLETTRVVALAPGPTAVFTLGLLMLATARIPVHLLLLPCLWCLIAGATGWSLGIAEDLALPVLGPVLLALAIRHNRRAALDVARQRRHLGAPR